MQDAARRGGGPSGDVDGICALADIERDGGRWRKGTLRGALPPRASINMSISFALEPPRPAAATNIQRRLEECNKHSSLRDAHAIATRGKSSEQSVHVVRQCNRSDDRCISTRVPTTAVPTVPKCSSTIPRFCLDFASSSNNSFVMRAVRSSASRSELEEVPALNLGDIRRRLILPFSGSHSRTVGCVVLSAPKRSEKSLVFKSRAKAYMYGSS